MIVKRKFEQMIWAFPLLTQLACADSDRRAPAQSATSALNPTGEAGPAVLSATGTQALSAALAASVQQGDAPGVVGLVVSRDGVLFEGTAGNSSDTNGTPMQPDAIFNIASMTKPVTSVAILMLYEQGKLGLDDPVSKYLPGFDALQVITSFDAASGAVQSAPATQVMTLRHLLNHTSGIGYSFANTTVARLLQGSPGPEWALPLLNEPGAAWNYSPGPRVLGQIVEKISGESLEDYFQAHIFEPLGMHDTSFAVAAEKAGRLPATHTRGAAGNLPETPQNAPRTPTPPFMGDGGLYSTARDYGQFMRMLLNGGTLDGAHILDASSVQLMSQNQIGDLFVQRMDAAIPALTKPFPNGAGKDKFGLGFQITSPESTDPVHRSAGSLAWAGLFNTEFWIDPQRQVAATLLMQVLPFYDDGALRALDSFESALYQNLAPSR